MYSKDKPDKRKVTFITGIDGFRAVAARNRDYRPGDDEPVIVYDDGLSRTAEDRNRWLYTTITRAERGLVILD